MKFYPAQGVYIAELLEDKEKIFVDTRKTRLIKGKVVAINPVEVTDFGIEIKTPIRVGDVVYFLSYEGDYDNAKIDGKTYYAVLRKDHRFVLK
ncbi:MAG: hypothetical protein KGJ89_05310 [Patescibacteria group bacterium]|nr:hypothetical protein [Patescibacteria group bacterium]MDE2015852.1 hypothetical protein [Patescibacteria group bacterium]MDE2227341.1 hypothetical protein [Patescibacteria group bacterium]